MPAPVLALAPALDFLPPFASAAAAGPHLPTPDAAAAAFPLFSLAPAAAAAAGTPPCFCGDAGAEVQDAAVAVAEEVAALWGT